MLVIKRKPGESFTIKKNGEIIRIKVFNNFKLGIDAPNDYKILRDELEELIINEDNIV